MDENTVSALASLTNDEGSLTPVGMAALRNRIAILESEVANHPQIQPKITHHFSEGVYARQMELNKEELVVGAIHKFRNLNIISRGKVTFFSIEGAKTVEAPFSFVAGPGVKRVIYAHEDTVWTTIHGTHETDLKKIEEHFIAKNYEDVYLASPRTLNDVLAIIGATPGELKAISENEDDLIDFPEPAEVFTSESKIHGTGIFARKHFWCGEIIGIAARDNKRTPLGRYSNHSDTANAKMVRAPNGDLVFVAIDDIAYAQEILTDYYFNYKTARGI